MAGMYPDNQEVSLNGEKVLWPGVDASGKFTDGDFDNPLVPPSFIPAGTINLILDNLSELIKKLGGTPDNTSIDQLAKIFTIAATANAGIMRDDSGRAKVAAPKEEDDIARKAEVDRGKEDTLASAKSYTDQQTQAEAQARVQDDMRMLTDAKRYSNELLAKIFQNGYIQWPGMPSPLEISALQFEGYSWYEINYSGSFFRAKGRSAKSFSPKKITKEQIKNGAYIFQNDEQGDAMRELEGTFGGDDSHFDHLSGVFKPKSHIKDLTTQADENDGWLIQFRASYQSPTAEENRPRNLTFVIWALVKDE